MIEGGKSVRHAGRRGPAGRLPLLGLTLIVALGGLAACGKKGDQRTPTAAPRATAAIGSATARPGGTPMVAQIADRIGAAWSGVTTYRAVTTEQAPEATSPPGSPAAVASPRAGGSSVLETIDEVVLPDRKRQIRRADGAVQYELVTVDGKVYARGPLAPGLSATRPDPSAWVEIDPSTLDPASPSAELYARLLAPAAAPYSALSPQERDRDAVPIELVTVDGRSCAAYRIADTTQTGERIEIVLALGTDDLPCSIETHAGNAVTTTVFTYNIPLTIEAPTGATPTTGAA